MLASVLCLATALYYEARSESLEGQLLVAEVVYNRVESEEFPDTVCDVVTQPGQFPWADEPLQIEEGEEFLSMVTLAGNIYLGYTELPGTDALFFHSGPRKGWFKTRRRIGRYGSHTFYE
jgi:spore germination cell wall hydrolase CwlJ-like protein